MEEKPATAQEVLEGLAACINAFDRILEKDLSLVAVSSEWSSIQSVGDHAQFLREQTAGLAAALESVPRTPSS